jgi:hypothetical protein
MAPNVMNSNWLRPTLALCALAGLLVLGGCGGGSGAPNNPFAPGPVTVGPLFLLPGDAVVYSHTATTLQVSGGATPYQAFSSNSAVLPVAQNVDTGVVVLIPGEVAADTPVTITVQDAIGQIATSKVTVRPAPLFNTLTVVPSRTVCGTNAVCSGDTATATVTVSGVAGGGIPNRQVRFDVITGAFAIQSSNPGQPLVSSLTVVTDGTGTARVVLQATVNVPTQPAQLRATDVTTGNSVTAAFTIVQQTDGSAILSVIPATATITGPDKNTCSSGVRVDYFIYGGTPPYHVAPSFPDTVTMVNTTVFASGGSFEVITNGSCVSPLTFTIVDAIGRQTTAQLINTLGTATPPPPPSPAIQVTPASVTRAACLTTTSFGFTITGGTPPFSVASPNGMVSPSSVTTSPGSFTFSPSTSGMGNYTIFVGDTSVPQKTASVTITCTS